MKKLFQVLKWPFGSRPPGAWLKPLIIQGSSLCPQDEVNRLGGNYGKCTTNGDDVNVKLLYNNSYTLQVSSEQLAEAPAYSERMNSKPALPHSAEGFYKSAGALLEQAERFVPL